MTGYKFSTSCVMTDKSLIFILPFGVLGLKKTEICLPFVTHDFATGEAPDGDDHGQ